MKQYKGKLSKEIKSLIEGNKRLLLRLIGGNGLGKVSSGAIYTIEESISKYNPGLSIDEIKAWVWYRRKKGVPMDNWKGYHVKPSENDLLKWVNSGVLFYDAAHKGELVPFPIFVFGNLYEKIAKTKANQDDIVSNYGKSVYDNHLKVLEELRPKPLSISNPIESERPVLLAIGETARNFMVNAIKDMAFGEPTTLQEAYKDWLRAQSDETFKKGTRPLEIINYYLNNESKPRRIDKDEWNSIKKNTRDEGERLFKMFLHDGLEYQDQLRIDADYNSRFNSTAPLQHNKIPIGIQVSKTFMDNELDIRLAQREGIAFMELVGSGIIAYDVGVGKTITAIIELANAINSGKCKRPLVAVPNPTYKNWIKEMFGVNGMAGILTGTGITLNEWYNLGADYDNIDLEKKVPERSITLVTYEGLQKIGFNEHTANDHFIELADIVSQSDSGTEREQEKDNEKLREVIGVGRKETICDIESLGIDYIVVDEAHNFKNVFAEVKADKEAGKQFHIKGGEPSNRGIKLFFLCNYIQRIHGRNIMLLTATPFTNSPLEIYSMLSFVAHDYMKVMGVYNIRTFFEQYIQETTEYVVGIDGEIQQRSVVKSFNNRISLQKLINSHINFKTGEEANIPRPCKINLPKTTTTTENGVKKLPVEDQVLTYLKMTPRQTANQLSINSEASEGADRNDPGKLLRLMSESLNNALSPFLYDKSQPKNYFEFVEESPKIKYTIECIRSVKKWHEQRNESVSGQVIYIDRGKEYFHYIKEYLEKELGYKKGVSLKESPRLKVDEVEVITSGISQDAKEKIKIAFNEGTCKIIIGTSTIKEGINLQEKSTCLYNLYPNWNPTDIRQLEGRIWRQKNMFQFVRIVMPLMENSMDVFVFQKLEEKTSRINDLWSKADRGNVLDEESLDPNEVKFALVTDLGVLARFETKQIAAELMSKKQVLKGNIDDLGNYVYLKSRLESYRGMVFNNVSTWISRMANEFMFDFNGRSIYFQDLSQLKVSDVESLSKENQHKIERYKEVYDELNKTMQGYDDKSLIKVASMYMRVVKKMTSDYQLEAYKETTSKYAKIHKAIFEQRGYNESTDLSLIRAEMEKELLLCDTEYAELETAEFQDKLMNRIIEQKKKYALKGGNLEDRVKDFSKLNHLMAQMFNINKKTCDVPSSDQDNDDKVRRLKIAKAKAKALKIKLKLAA